MKMSDMKVKSWYKIQLIAKSKTFKVTKQEFKTKSEGTEKGISKGYDILNLKALNRLICEGWTEYTTKEENASNKAVGVVNIVEAVEQSNPEIEAQIEAYTQAKIERDIEAYAQKKAREEAKKANEEALIRFLSTPPQQPKFKPFNYTKAWDDYETKGKPKAEKALDKQLKEYRECEHNVMG